MKISVDLNLVQAILYSGLFFIHFRKKNNYMFSAFHLVCILYKAKTSEMECLENGN